MLKTIKEAFTDFSHLLFPHNCIGCGTDILQNDAVLCAKCFEELPYTNFLQHPDNPIEKIFYGRIKTEHAGSLLYFTKNSIVQSLVFALKYKGDKEAGFFLGRLLGMELAQCGRFDDIDAIVPLPLNEKKEKKRGYNQALVIAEGMQMEWEKPILKNAVIRKHFTETQTKKGRTARWQNMEDVFEVRNEEEVSGKHLLVIDDVVTTGASLEACAAAILKAPDVKISFATVAYTIL
jgi:ComF family protein